MKKILVVDDELGIRDLLSEILQEEGYDVQTAENAVQARNAVRSSRFDLILLDIWMPDEDGISLLKDWKKHNFVSCPIIMMSGHGTIETAMEATRFGAVDFLEKPISLKKLLSTCQRVSEQWNNITRAGKEILREQDSLQTNALLTPQNAFYRVLDSGIPTQNNPTPRIPVIEIPTLGIVLDFNKNFRDMREDFEKAYLTQVLKFRGGSVSALSKHSELERTHLYRKLRGLGIDPAKFVIPDERNE